MKTRTRRLLVVFSCLVLAAVGVAYYALSTRGFGVRLENRSTRTFENLRFLYEDGVIEVARLGPGETVNVRFRPRPSDGLGGEFTFEAVRKGFPAKDKDYDVGVGLFVTKGRAIYLHLVDTWLPDGRLGVKMDGYWTESMSPYRNLIQARGGQMPGTTPWPSTILDEEP